MWCSYITNNVLLYFSLFLVYVNPGFVYWSYILCKGAKFTNPKCITISLACRLFWVEDKGPKDSGRISDIPLTAEGASQVVLVVKTCVPMQEVWVRALGQEDPREKGMATHSSILAWRIPWTEEPGRLQTMGLQRVRHDWVTDHTHTHTHTHTTVSKNTDKGPVPGRELPPQITVDHVN